MYFHDAETEHTDMKIFWTPASPFTRKVCVAARELGLWERIEVVPTTWSLEWGYKTVPLTAGLAEANPVARIPTLVTEEGAPLGDLTLACIYLDEVSDNGGLIPSGDALEDVVSLRDCRWHAGGSNTDAGGAFAPQRNPIRQFYRKTEGSY